MITIRNLDQRLDSNDLLDYELVYKDDPAVMRLLYELGEAEDLNRQLADQLEDAKDRTVRVRYDD